MTLHSRINVYIDLAIVDGVWMWPKINIVGCSTEGEYEAVTATYAELGAHLVRAARKRQQHWQREESARRPAGAPPQDPPVVDGVVQLTLSENWLPRLAAEL